MNDGIGFVATLIKKESDPRVDGGKMETWKHMSSQIIAPISPNFGSVWEGKWDPGYFREI